MMKRLVGVLVCAVCAFVLSACEDNPPPSAEPQTGKDETVSGSAGRSVSAVQEADNGDQLLTPIDPAQESIPPADQPSEQPK